MPKKKVTTRSTPKKTNLSSLSAQVVSLLKNYQGRYLSLRELSNSLEANEKMMERVITRLNRKEYRIEIHPFRGLRYISKPTRLNPQRLRALLGRTAIGRDLYVLEKIRSTSDLALTLGEKGFPHGSVVFASEQTRGRGRFGNTWQSRKDKGLWFSVLLRPPTPMPKAGILTLSFAMAVALTLEKELGLKPQIRWPNDILLSGKKVAGILLEAKTLSLNDTLLVMGMGMNVRHRRSDFSPALRETATSLTIMGARGIREERLAARLLESMGKWYGKACKGKSKAIERELLKRSFILGKRVQIGYRGSKFEGVVVGILAEEGLRVRLTGGDLQLFPGDHTQVLAILD